MPDQAAHLRQLVRASVHADATLAPGGPVITLSGAQPAAGVTTIACGLARELTRLGKQTILIDANLAMPNVTAHLLPTNPQRAANSPDQAWSGLRGTISDVLSGARRAVEVLIPTTDDGLRYIAGCPPDSNPPLNLEAANRFTAELTTLSRHVDVILIDAGHGMNPWVDRLWQLSCEVLLTAPPIAQGLLDAYAVAKLSQHHRHDAKLRLLISGARDQQEAGPLGHRFAETCQRFLNIRAKPATSLPAFNPRPSESTSAQRQQDRDSFQRALRLLAADLTAELRVASLRLIRPTLPSAFSSDLQPIRDLSQRRRGAEEGPKYLA